MSGIYSKKVYLADNFTSKFAITIQPETQTLVFNGVSNPDAGIDYIGRPIIVGAGSRKLKRFVARSVSFRFTGAVPDGYKPNAVLSLPWLRPEQFANLIPGKAGTYRGLPVVVVGRKEERLPYG